MVSKFQRWVLSRKLRHRNHSEKETNSRIVTGSKIEFNRIAADAVAKLNGSQVFCLARVALRQPAGVRIIAERAVGRLVMRSALAGINPSFFIRTFR